MTPVRSAARLLQATPDEASLAWLLEQELTTTGPWQLRADAACGGWPIETDGHLHLDVEATCTVLDALADSDAGQGPRAGDVWAASRRATDVLWAMQEADGSFSRFERGEAAPPMRRLPWNDADLLAFGDEGHTSHGRLTALALSCLGRAGFRLDDDRMGRGMRWLEHTFAADLATTDLEMLSALARCVGALTPVDAPFRRAVDRQLRGRQHEDGSFGAIADTARALRGLLDLDGVCVQARRAARWLVANGGIPAATPCDGHGLSPACTDPSGAAAESLLALRAFDAGGGKLPESRT